MAQLFIPLLIASTSVLVAVAGRRGLQLSPAALRRAMGKTFECVGVMLAFFALNLAIGIAGVFLWRYLTRTFLSLYNLNDLTLLGLSFLQGLLFQWWRYEGRAASRESRAESWERSAAS